MIEPADGGELVGRPGGHDRAAVRAGAGAEVDHPVGRADHRLVVLDDQHAVALLAEPSQAGEQPAGVAGMEAGRRLVEDVADADQPRADLGRQPARWSSPPESVSSPGRASGSPARPVEEREPPGDLADQGRADRLARPGRMRRPSKNARASSIGQRDRPRGSTARRADRPGLGPEPGAAAGRAGGSWLDVGLGRRDDAQAVAGRAGPVGAVEAEAPGLDLRQARAAGRAGEVDAQDAVVPARVGDLGGDRPGPARRRRASAPGRGSRPAGAGCPRGSTSRSTTASMRVGLGLGQLGRLVGDLDDLAVDPGPDQPRAADRLEDLERAAPCGRGPAGPGACTFRPVGKASTWSTICSGVWRRIGAPQFGQCGVPGRA